MINNRQNGRRRGRGGQQVRGGQPGMPDRGSRVDNRARGNAAQLLEKYKSLARDAQMQGDRVNTEYYLQFADHYFRVLSENRSRFDEQRPEQQRGRHENYRDDMGADGNREDMAAEEDGGDDRQRGFEGQNGWDDREEGEEASSEQNRYEPRREEAGREPRRREEQRSEQQRPEQQRRDEPLREEPPRERAARDVTSDAARPIIQDEGERYQERRPRRPRTRSAEGNGNPVASAAIEAPVAERIEVERLPQGFGTTPVAPASAPVEAGVEEIAERPRRRAPRRPRADAPAAEA